MALDLNIEPTEADYVNAMKKIISASALYDKNAPGCSSLDAFDAAYLTPASFREVVKKAFNLVFTQEELLSVIKRFSDDTGNNVSCSKFLIHFIKTGAEERDKIKLLQLEKQRHDNYLRKSEHERKMKESEDKVMLTLSDKYSEADQDKAFEKLTIAAKKYDRSHPGAMSLDGFDEKELKPHVFREMIKRTFGLILTPAELAATVSHYDPKNTGKVSSKKFLIHFLKLGIAERNKDLTTNLQKLREDAEIREREAREKLATQWAKMELSLTFEYTVQDKETAIEKLKEAAHKFDASNPMGLTAFEVKTMSPAGLLHVLQYWLY